ncbi:MAG: methyltransferase domain-containing protein [Chthoniobacterales bacterium]
MSPPLRLLSNPNAAAGIIARFSKSPCPPGTSYATVRDYCESLDELPQVTAIDGDLKNVQRPWAVKALLANVPPPGRLLEIGGGEPIISGFLAELGYDVTLVDPYDGFGNGPTDYQRYVELFPNVKIRREYFRPKMAGLAPGSFDAIFSVSVLEHLPPPALAACFEAIAEFLSPRGFSIHCFDFILQGVGDAHDLAQAQNILSEQQKLGGQPTAEPLAELVQRLRADVETFFLSPQGHHQWRGGQAYPEFPFRKVVSLQTIVSRSPTP